MIDPKFMKSNNVLYKIGTKNPETLAAVHTHTQVDLDIDQRKTKVK